MRQADIEVGGEYGWKSFQGLSRVRVIEKGLRSSPYHKRSDAVLIEHVGGYPFSDQKTVSTRNIVPWGSHEDAQLEREQRKTELAARIERVAARLDVTAVGQYGSWVRVAADDFFELARRLGVETD